MPFFQVEVLKKAEPKLGHILRIYFEIAHITFCKFKDLIKMIWLLLSPELVSFSTVCRRGQQVRGVFVCVISFSAEQLHMVCCISQLAKYFIFFFNYCWIGMRCVSVSHPTVRDKVNKLMAVVDIWRENGNYLGSKKIDLNYFKSCLFLCIKHVSLGK